MVLKDLDLNLLIVLDILLREQNVTRAADRLNVTQSAVSSSLKRLRAAFNDELLVLVGRKMQLTPRAEALKPKISELIAQIERTVAEKVFDPMTVDHRFVLGTADYATFVLLPAILRVIEEEAPNLTVDLVDLTEHCVEDLLAGKVDAIIAPRSYVKGDGMLSRTLFKEKMVCVAARGHPAVVKGAIDVATFRRLPHLRYQPVHDLEAAGTPSSYARRKNDPTAILTCSSFAALTYLVGETSAVALVQERLAWKFQKVAGLQIVPSPVRTAPLDMALFWGPSRNSDAPHMWLRSTIARAAKEI